MVGRGREISISIIDSIEDYFYSRSRSGCLLVDVEKVVVLVCVRFRRSGLVAVGVLCRGEGRTYGCIFARRLVNQIRFLGSSAQCNFLDLDAAVAVLGTERVGHGGLNLDFCHDTLYGHGYGRGAGYDLCRHGSCHCESSGAHGLCRDVCVGAVVGGDVAFQLFEQLGLGGDVIRYVTVNNDIEITRGIGAHARKYELDRRRGRAVHFGGGQYAAQDLRARGVVDDKYGGGDRLLPTFGSAGAKGAGSVSYTFIFQDKFDFAFLSTVGRCRINFVFRAGCK